MQGEATETLTAGRTSSELIEPALEPAALARVPEVLPAASNTPAVVSPPAEGVFCATSSADITSLITGIVAAQLAFDAIEKNREADVQSKREGARSFKYRYADLGEVLSVVRPKLAENNVGLIQLPEVRRARDNRPVVTITTILAHTSGQYLKNELTLPVDGTDPQAIGSAITYARRYALQAILGVAPEEDDDGASASRRPLTPAVQMPQRASANGNGNGHPPPGTTGTRSPVSSQDPSAPNGGASGALLIARLEKKRASNDSLYWVVELSNKQQALTFDTKIGERLEEWFKAHTPIQEMTTATRGGRPHIDEITARVS